MRPRASSDQALGRMRRQMTRDTGPEILLRRELHRRGLRYRVDQAVVPGLRRRQDIVFRRRRIVVDVRGCYWHACPAHGTKPKANAAWWADKLTRNVDRDEDTMRRLDEAGWTVVVVWEHEDPVEAADRVEAVLLRTEPIAISHAK
jgi:DNA mismatch endonuclease (patch repair protein)